MCTDPDEAVKQYKARLDAFDKITKISFYFLKDINPNFVDSFQFPYVFEIDYNGWIEKKDHFEKHINGQYEETDYLGNIGVMKQCLPLANEIKKLLEKKTPCQIYNVSSMYGPEHQTLFPVCLIDTVFVFEGSSVGEK